jgi:nucleotide-binding universal stress UspA family protein
MFKNILAAVDGSKLSLAALELAAQMASEKKGELKIVSAIEPLPPIAVSSSYTGDGGINPIYLEHYSDDQRKGYESIHSECISHLREKYKDLTISSVIKEGKAANVIQEESEGYDLIVMGHRGQGGILDWMLGSVAKTVVDRCTVPVLIYKDECHMKK